MCSVSQLTELGRWRSERVYCFTAHSTGSVEVRESVLFHSSWNGVSGGQRGYTVSQLTDLDRWRSARVLFHSSQNLVSGDQRHYSVSRELINRGSGDQRLIHV